MKVFAQKSAGLLVGLTIVATFITVAIATFDWIDGKNWLTPDRILRSENLVVLAFVLLGNAVRRPTL